MNAVLIVELDDDVNLEDVEINYIVQDKYGNPIKAEVDGVKLRPLPKYMHMGLDNELEEIIFQMGFNTCLNEIKEALGETE